MIWRSTVRLVRIRRSPSKILLEVSGNAGVEGKARNCIESIARFGERANDSLRRKRSTLRAEVNDLAIDSKISPHPEVLTQVNLAIQSRPDSDSMDLRPIGASGGLTSFCGSSRCEILLTICHQLSATLLSGRSFGHCNLKAELCQSLHQAAFHLILVETIEEVCA
jgi:hypothetical protein